MEPGSRIEFLTPKCSFLPVVIIATTYASFLFAIIFAMIHKGPIVDIVFLCLIGCAILTLWGALRSFHILFKVSFSADLVQLDYYLLFFKKRIIIRYDDLRVVLCRPKHKLMTFYRKGFYKPGISTSMNKYWREEQITQMAKILSDHNVTVKYI